MQPFHNVTQNAIVLEVTHAYEESKNNTLAENNFKNIHMMI